MNDPVVSMEMIERSALMAADTNAGPQANPYVEGSEAFKHWLVTYYSRVQELAMRCAV